MKFRTFDQWLEINPQPPVENCPMCDGSGEHECECGHTHACGVCDGTGRAGPDYLVLARQQYEREKAADVARLAAWGVAV